MKDTTIETHIKNGLLAPSYLLVDRDILKLKSIAEWFSKNFNPADIFHLENTQSAAIPAPQQSSGARNIKVEETEEFISKAYLASIGGKKLFVICDASTMTLSAQNKILKTLEDAPADTCFMLLASSGTPLLNTIKSRCIIIYPDPVNPSLTETAMFDGNPNTGSIFIAVEKLLTKCQTLDDAMPYIPLLTKKENLPITLTAVNHHATKLTIRKRTAILKCLAIINRNISAGCNPQNAFDILLMELFR